MGMGLALAGGLLSGVGQGVADDVAQLMKDRAADLAHENQKEILGISNDYAVARQSAEFGHADTAAETANKNAVTAASTANQNAVTAAALKAQTDAAAAKLAQASSERIADKGDDRFQTNDGKIWTVGSKGYEPVTDAKGNQLVGPLTATKATGALTDNEIVNQAQSANTTKPPPKVGDFVSQPPVTDWDGVAQNLITKGRPDLLPVAVPPDIVKKYTNTAPLADIPTQSPFGPASTGTTGLLGGTPPSGGVQIGGVAMAPPVAPPAAPALQPPAPQAKADYGSLAELQAAFKAGTITGPDAKLIAIAKGWAK